MTHPQYFFDQNNVNVVSRTKVEVIDMMDYGMMEGDVVLEKALKMME